MVVLFVVRRQVPLSSIFGIVQSGANFSSLKSLLLRSTVKRFLTLSLNFSTIYDFSK
jgi:hypothetical protein